MFDSHAIRHESGIGSEQGCRLLVDHMFNIGKKLSMDWLGAAEPAPIG
jgi:hypothetical protein